MELWEFEKEVRTALEKLPSKYRKILAKEKISVLPREKVPEGVRQRHPGKTIFGLFAGVSKKNKRTFSIQTEPTRIEIYKESFENMYGPRISAAMKEHIFRTVVHEIAHYFGFDEEEVRDRGY